VDAQLATSSYLIVDDDRPFRERLQRALIARGLSAHTAADHDEALAVAVRERPERAIVDLRMPERSGLEVVRSLRRALPDLRIVMLTGYGSFATAVDAVRLGAANFIAKPADADDILAAFERAARPPLTGVDSDYRAPSLARAEWEHLQRVLADSGGNVSEAARRLGIHRRSLQRKLTKRPPAE
jgi:two-component system response regulator RegA